MNISGIIVDIILFFIIAGNAVINYRRGLVKVVFNIFSSIIAIILVLILYKPATNFVINNTQLASNLQNTIETKLEYLFETESSQISEKDNANGMNSILKIFIGQDLGQMIETATDSITESLSTQISYKIISVLTFFVLFVIIRLLLYMIKNYIDLVANLPIIRVLNGSGGMIFGIIKGFFTIYAVFAIISLVVPIVNGTIIIDSIQNSLIGSQMFNNNILLNIIFKFL